MATMEAEPQSEQVDTDNRPIMTTNQILMMNVGFFGVQFSFGLTQTAVNPLFLALGATPHDLPLLNLAGPVTGLLVQPMIGAMSDRTWHPKWGRRRPFIVFGALLCVAILIVFPLVGALWLAVVCYWLLDVGNNTSMEPYRAFISDRLPKSQLARGFLTQSMFTGAGAVLANVSIYVFQKLLTGTADSGVPYWAFVCCWIGVVCIAVTVLLAMSRTKELTPSDEELAEIRSAPTGVGNAIKDIASAVRAMPVAMHKIGLVFAFQWYAMFIYWQFVSVSVGESVFGVVPEDPGFQEAAGWSGLMNGTYNLFTLISALFLVRFCQKYGGKKVHAACLGIAAVSLMGLSQITNQWFSLVPMIGLGICWASMVGVPYLMVASMVPRERTGVYMGILNMMIVVPMLVETVTFGWIFENLLDSKGTNAMLLCGAMLAVAGVAMLWVNPPEEGDESPIMPLGAQRHISVYDQVVVGTDGTATSLYAVDRAAEVATAAQAKLVVISAYSEGAAPSDRPSQGLHRDLYGAEKARDALKKSVGPMLSKRVRYVDQRIVEGDPAQALLDAVGRSPASLIVVGNRGLGAVEGQLLGSVPGNVVKKAECDVLVVQTSALDEDRLMMVERVHEAAEHHDRGEPPPG